MTGYGREYVLEVFIILHCLRKEEKVTYEMLCIQRQGIDKYLDKRNLATRAYRVSCSKLSNNTLQNMSTL